MQFKFHTKNSKSKFYLKEIILQSHKMPDKTIESSLRTVSDLSLS